MSNPTKSRILFRATVIVVCSLGLFGCFDLAQKLSIDRGGAGHYEVAITATGLLGEALKDNKANFRIARNRARTRIVTKDGRVTQIAVIDFKSLSQLRLSDESLSLANHGASWFGLGPSHLTFSRTFLVDRARRENAPKSADAEKFGGELLQTMFGDHTYVFSVTVPGSVDKAAPVQIGRTTIRPQVSGQGLSHTVTWRMPLTTLLGAKLVRFQVDFSAYGSFPDAQSLPAGGA
ncbi:MAG TPA: hypothetical protein VLC74_04765 [Rhizomicrobium sp.]|nr:hypothetical protein [Rhizomicrobium sp.]